MPTSSSIRPRGAVRRRARLTRSCASCGARAGPWKRSVPTVPDTVSSSRRVRSARVPAASWPWAVTARCTRSRTACCKAGGESAVLGVVPIGSGNDFAKLVGLARHSPVRAVRRLVTAHAVAFDVGHVLDEYFVNSAGVGFGAEVVRVRNAMPGLSGFLSYLVPVFRAFARFRPPRLEVRASGFGETGYMMMVEICNGTTAGGSYRFAPAALPGDGRLDVCVVRRVSLARFLLAVPRVMRGTHGTMREVALFQTRSLTLRSLEGPLVLHLDGELREPDARQCTVRVEPGRLNVLVAQ